MSTEFILLQVVVLVTTLVQVECNNETCTERYTIIPGPTPRDGRDGIQGVPGRTGDKGDRGDIGPPGPKGDPGSVMFADEYLNDVCDNVTSKINKSIIAELWDTIQTLNQTLTERLLYLESHVQQTSKPANNSITLCNITSSNWRRIAYFDTTQGDSCPTGLRTASNTTTNQTACGRNGSSHGCSNIVFPSMGNYSMVCGKVRGYQHFEAVAFYPYNSGSQTTIDSIYTAGISITQGSPRQHLWTYVVGTSETSYQNALACPCARPGYNSSWIPSFVGENYYCESGLIGDYPNVITTMWEDPLWDGNGCFAPNNTCCNRYGWFYRHIQESSKYVEVRVCGYNHGYRNSDVPLDQLGIWVM